MYKLLKLIYLVINIMSLDIGQTIVDVKNNFTKALVLILSPQIFDMYLKSYNSAIKYGEQAEKTKYNFAMIFKQILHDIQGYSSVKIEKITNSIRAHSGCPDYFDDLIKAVVKLNILEFAFIDMKEECNTNTGCFSLLENKVYDTISIPKFIHLTLMKSATLIDADMSLFVKLASSKKIKAKNEIDNIIKESIYWAIFNILPIKEIISYFLKKDFKPLLLAKKSMEILKENKDEIKENEKIEIPLIQPKSPTKSLTKFPAVKTPIQPLTKHESDIEMEIKKELEHNPENNIEDLEILSQQKNNQTLGNVINTNNNLVTITEPLKIQQTKNTVKQPTFV